MTTMEPRGLVFETTALLNPSQQARELRVVFGYLATDPWAISMVMHTTTPVPWTFARELIADGLNTTTGHGDVRVVPAETAVTLELSSPSGAARLAFARASLEKLIEHTEHLVPLGAEAEHVDWDDALATLAPQRGDR